MILLQILAATFIISLIAFVGIVTLALKKEWLNKIILILVALSSGALLGGAFLHLLPEAIEDLGAGLDVFLSLLLGFCLFFVLEQFLHWHHQHDTKNQAIKPFSYLILISDGVHNFIDGLVIAASFLVSFPAGVATTLAVGMHEIPQELGDFGVLVHGGMSKSKALFFNYITALTAIAGGVIGYFAAEFTKVSVVYLLPFAAGHFIYIAAADLIPEIKHRETLSKSLLHFVAFLAGIGIMLLARFIH